MRKINTFIKQITLLVLLVSALNLSFQITMPQKGETSYEAGSLLAEQVFLFTPFTDKESSQQVNQVYSINSPLFTFSYQWLSLHKTLLTLELFYRQGQHIFREYPFVVIVRNLRI